MDGEELHRPSPPALVHRTGLRQGQDLSTQQVTLHNRRASHNKTGMEWGSDMGLGTRLGNRDGLGTRLCRPSLVPRPSITANAVEGLVKLLRRMTSGGRKGGRRTFGGVVLSV